MMIENPLNPALALDFHDLYNFEGLQKVEVKFHEFFAAKNQEVYNNFIALKNNPASFVKKQQMAILIDAARVVEDFLVYLFNIEKENAALKNVCSGLLRRNLRRRRLM